MEINLARINLLKRFTFTVLGLLSVFVLLNRYYFKMSVKPIIQTIAVVGVLSYLLLRICIKIYWDNENKRELEYINKVKSLADSLVMAYEDDKIEDIWLIYDEKEKEQLIEILMKMPVGKRHLKEAILELDKSIE